jgi:hypothetical protein
LSEEDLLKLVKLDIGDDAILAKIAKDGVRVQADDGLSKRLRAAGVSVKVLAAVESAARTPAAPEAITFEDVLTLLRLDIPSDAILQRIKRSGKIPTLTADQRTMLRAAGASAAILEYLDK